MPVILRALLTATDPMTPSTGEFHHLACSLFEFADAKACHTGQEKPFSIWPLRPGPGKPGRSLGAASRLVASRSARRSRCVTGQAEHWPHRLRGRRNDAPDRHSRPASC